MRTGIFATRVYQAWCFCLGMSVFAAHTATPKMPSWELERHLQQCVPDTYHDVVKKIVEKESGFRPYSINANGVRLKLQPKNKEEAKVFIKVLRENKVNFDIGLAQINSQHFLPGRFFERYGFTLEHALDPCTNLLMSAAIFDEAYGRTKSFTKALSIYNTGSPVYGMKNGYVSWFLKDQRFVSTLEEKFQR